MMGYNPRIVRMAINTLREDNYIEYTDASISGELVFGEDPETLLLAKEKAEEKANAFNSLSDEAKQVINLVLNAPAEVLSVISSRKRHNITKKRIADMLQRQWKDRRSVNNVIREVEKYASLI